MEQGLGNYRFSWWSLRSLPSCSGTPRCVDKEHTTGTCCLSSEPDRKWASRLRSISAQDSSLCATAHCHNVQWDQIQHQMQPVLFPYSLFQYYTAIYTKVPQSWFTVMVNCKMNFLKACYFHSKSCLQKYVVCMFRLGVGCSRSVQVYCNMYSKHLLPPRVHNTPLPPTREFVLSVVWSL